MKRYKVIIALMMAMSFPVSAYAASDVTEGFAESTGGSFSSSDISAGTISGVSTSSGTSSTDFSLPSMGESSSGFSDSTDGTTFTSESSGTGTAGMPDMSSFDGMTSGSGSSESFTEKSDLDKFNDAYDQSREVMKSNLPTLETESIDDLRTELTESMKANASTTLKDMMGSSFTSLGDSLYDIKGLPSMDTDATESLNVHFADMKTAFDSASNEVSDSLGSVETETEGSSIGTVSDELSKWRESAAYKSISSKISLSDVFGSLSNQLPDQDKGTEDTVYNSNVASQSQWAANAKNKATNSAKSKAQSSNSSASSKIKSAANSWAANKSTNPVTGGSMGKDKTVTASAPSSFTNKYNEQQSKASSAANAETGASKDFIKNYNAQKKASQKKN